MDAVTAGDFHIFKVASIDQGIELLTGMEAGTPDAEGHFPYGTFNYRVARRLSELAPPGDVLFASNSMPIRDLQVFRTNERPAQAILANPLAIVLIAIPLIVQTYLIFWISAQWMRRWGQPRAIAAPGAMIRVAWTVLHAAHGPRLDRSRS